MKFYLCFLALFFFVVSNHSLHAQTPWEQMKGPGGGMITSLAVLPSGHIFAARIDEVLPFGGVYRSTDNGSHWQESDSGLDHLHGSYSSLQTDSYGNIFLISITGVYRSSNDGVYWSRMNTGLLEQSVVTMLMNSQTGNLILFGDSGTFRSTDHGDHWSKTSKKDFSFDNSIALDSAGILTATGYAAGVFRSTDEGFTWNKIAPLPSGTFLSGLVATKSGILIGCDPSNHNIFRSIDKGVSWQKIDSNLKESYLGQPFVSSTGAIFMGLSGTSLFSKRILRSTDNGDSWVELDNGLTELPFIEVNCFTENQQGNIFAGLTEGVFRSTDNGDHWEQANNELLLSSCSSIIEGASGHLFAATDFGQVYRSKDSGMTWTLASNGISVAPIPRIIIFGIQGSIFGELAREQISATPNGHLFAGSNTRGYLYKSIDEGDHWIAVDSSFSPYRIGTDPSGRIFAEAVNNATSKNAIFRSVDDGDHWKEVSTPGAIDTFYATAITSNQAGHIFIIGNNVDYLQGTNVGTVVYISKDHGDTWSISSNGIGAYSINSLVAGTGGMLIAGADSGGIFRSMDEGAHWTQVLNLYDSAVTSLSVHSDGTIFAGLMSRVLENGGVGIGQNDTLGGDLIISTDNGLSWKSNKSGIKHIRENGIAALHCTSSGYTLAGLGYGKGGGIYRSYLSPHSDVSQISLNQVATTLSPNPTTGIVSVNGLPLDNITVSVMNILGETVMEQENPSAPDFTLDLSRLVPGSYYIRFSSANSVVTKKVVKN